METSPGESLLVKVSRCGVVVACGLLPPWCLGGEKLAPTLKADFGELLHQRRVSDLDLLAVLEASPRPRVKNFESDTGAWSCLVLRCQSVRKLLCSLVSSFYGSAMVPLVQDLRSPVAWFRVLFMSPRHRLLPIVDGLPL